jgi:hypothetical protein
MINFSIMLRLWVLLDTPARLSCLMIVVANQSMYRGPIFFVAIVFLTFGRLMHRLGGGATG